MKKNHLHNRIFFCVVFVLMLSALFVAGALAVHAKTAPVTYISSAEEFKNAVISRQEMIYIDDITFDTPETVVLCDSVAIIGKHKKSTIKNLHIQIQGSELFENKIKIELKNIIFDGCFDITKYDITQEKPFDEVFGAENDNGFLSIEANGIGYYDIEISDCEFTNYSGWWGAVISLPSNKSENGNKRLKQLEEMNQSKDKFLSAVRKFMEMKDLTPALMRELIDHIDVYETEGTGKSRTQRIVIHYRFVDCIEIPDCPKQHHRANTRKGVEVEYLTA